MSVNTVDYLDSSYKLGGTYHLQGKIGNSSWKIKYLRLYYGRLGSFRKYGLQIDKVQFIFLLF